MARFWRDYSLSITLAVLFFVAWVAHFVTGWFAYVDEQSQSQAAATMGGYLWRWAEATFENWQSEFLQLFCMVVLTAFLIHRGSKESKDSSERLERKIDRIRATVRELRREEIAKV